MLVMSLLLLLQELVNVLRLESKRDNLDLGLLPISSSDGECPVDMCRIIL